jgi:hypothetical protein
VIERVDDDEDVTAVNSSDGTQLVGCIRDEWLRGTKDVAERVNKKREAERSDAPAALSM